MRSKIRWTAIFAGAALVLAAVVVIVTTMTAPPAPAARTEAAKTSPMQAWAHGKGGRYLQTVAADVRLMPSNYADSLSTRQLDADQTITDAALADEWPPPVRPLAYEAAMQDAEVGGQMVLAGNFRQADRYFSQFTAGIAAWSR